MEVYDVLMIGKFSFLTREGSGNGGNTSMAAALKDVDLWE